MSKFIVVAIVATLACAVSVSAWGDVGHQTTATVAQALLSASATSNVNSILSGQSLESVATWADSVKYSPGYEWSAVLHYIDTPDWECSYNPDGDCPNQACVAGATANYTTRLTNQDLNAFQINEALKFLTHFGGDIHQPLHVAFASDRGGNEIKGTYNGDDYNLHAVWDTALVMQRINNDFSGDQNQYAQYLISQVQGPWKNQAAQWATCPDGSYSCPNAWAAETGGLACTQAYVDQNGDQIKNGFSLGTDYYNFNKDIVDQQLAKGGVRLALTLNGSFPSRAAIITESLPSNDVEMAVQEHRSLSLA